MTQSVTQDAKAVVRRYYQDLWNSWNFDAAADLIAPDISFRGSLGLVVRGRVDFLDYVRMVRTAFPDFHNSIEELIAEDDKVAARLTYGGTHQGALFGVAPTNRHVTYAGVAIFRIFDRQIVEGWVLGDLASLMQQLQSSTTAKPA
jgi:steroid delta-isomerase-like uncharacterized protein